MILRKNRFRGLGSVRPCLKYGRSLRASGLSLKYLKRNHTQHPRFAVLVSKKVSKKAVVRNRIRRRLMAAAKPHLERIHEPWDLVVVVYDREYATKPWTDVESVAGNMLQRFN